MKKPDINDILRIMPHRYPFLMVDRIIDIGEDTIVGIKNVTINEPQFTGHFPSKPVFPGVLILESIAQTGGILIGTKIENPEKKLVLFMSIDKAKFRKLVEPGDQLRLEIKLLRFQGKIIKLEGKAFVGEDLVSSAEMMATLADKNPDE